MLKIKNLQVKFKKKLIIDKIDLSIKKSEIHILMGRNGAGKSTLAQSIMGNPDYQASGELLFDGQDLLVLDPQQRAALGIFLSFQQVLEIPGVKVYDYLRLLYKKSHQQKLTPRQFKEFVNSKLEVLALKEDFLKRSLNVGFSGGEKKKMEVLQMLILEPKLVILDEIDSGLDVEAIQMVAKAVSLLHQQGSAILLITHYSRIVEYLQVDQVHLVEAGKVSRRGGVDLIKEIEAQGF